MPRFKVNIGFELDAPSRPDALVKALKQGEDYVTYSSVKQLEGSFNESATRQIFGGKKGRR